MGVEDPDRDVSELRSLFEAFELAVGMQVFHFLDPVGAMTFPERWLCAMWIAGVDTLAVFHLGQTHEGRALKGMHRQLITG